MVPREGLLLTKVIQAHAHEAEDILHHSTDDESVTDTRLKILTPPANLSLAFSPTNLGDSKLYHSMNELPESNTTNNLYSMEGMIQPKLNSPSRAASERRKKGGHPRITKAVSTPLLIGQSIIEERESDLEDSPVASPRFHRTPKHHPQGGGVIRSKRQSRRLSPVQSTGSRRSSSCSSSDEDEIEKRMRRLNTNNTSCKKSARRGSHEDSSSEGDGGGLGGGCKGKGRGRGNTGGGALSTSSNSKPGPSTKNTSTNNQENGSGNTKNCNFNKNEFNYLNENLTRIEIDTDDKENYHENSQNRSRSSSEERKLSSIDRKETEIVSSSFLNCGYCSSDENAKKAQFVSKEHKPTKEEIPKNPLSNCNQINPTIINSIITETSVMKVEENEQQDNCSGKCERKGSAFKYIHSQYSAEDWDVFSKEGNASVNGLKRDSLTPCHLENIEMNMKRMRTNDLCETSDSQIIRTPGMHTVTSNCCQIF